MPSRRNGRGFISLRLLTILCILVLTALTVAVAIYLWTLYRRHRAYTAPLHTTGVEPEKRISDLKSYRLRIRGMANREVSLTLDAVKALGAERRDVPLACVVGWTDYRVWRGVPLRDLIARAEPDPEATFVVFRDDRDFSSSLSMQYVQSGRPILAWQAGGETLPREHGWPLRVVAPGKWGYKWVKWVTEIELTDRGYEGTYEETGFSLNGDIDEPKKEAEKRRAGL